MDRRPTQKMIYVCVYSSIENYQRMDTIQSIYWTEPDLRTVWDHYMSSAGGYEANSEFVTSVFCLKSS